MLLILSINSFAQDKNRVTRFLGIPVDGTKAQMIQNLKAKGFMYNSEMDFLTGEFNGRNVDVMVVTDNNKVWRIMLSDVQTSSATDIRIRFNTLCNQFERNKKYCFPNFQEVDYTIPEDEDLQYEILVHQKRYEASFWQGSIKDSVELEKDILPETQEILNKVWGNLTQEQIQQLPTEEKQEKASEIISEMLQAAAEKFSKRSVWFMISKDTSLYSDYDRPYRILMYYDNEYNHSNGEDL